MASMKGDSVAYSAQNMFTVFCQTKQLSTAWQFGQQQARVTGRQMFGVSDTEQRTLG